MKRLLPLLALAGLAAPAFAQTASYTFFGKACATMTVPFQAIGTPRLGSIFKVRIRSTASSPNESFSSLLFTGSSNRSLGPIPLPFSMAWYKGSIGLNKWSSCGSLYTSSEFVFVVPRNRIGPLAYDVVIPIPNDKRLLGLRFYQQPLLIYSSTMRFSTTYNWGRGGTGTIGL